MTGTSATRPASANSRATSAIRRSSRATPTWCQTTFGLRGASLTDAAWSRALGAEHHARADGLERRLVDEDEAAGDAVAAVLVDEERRRRPQRHAPQVVHG